MAQENVLLDRFIPHRSRRNFQFGRNNNNLNNSFDNVLLPKECTDDIVNLARKKYHKNNYRKLLKDALLQGESRWQITEDPFKTITWPVKSRSKPLLKQPTRILDMPDFHVDKYPRALDWGKNGIVCSLNGELLVGNFKNNVTVCTETEGQNGNCVKWSPDGLKIAVAGKSAYIYLYDLKFKRKESSFRCLGCTVTAIVWFNTKSFASGCNCGRLCFWGENLQLIKTFLYSRWNGAIGNMKLSAQNKYLMVATSGAIGICDVAKMEEYGKFIYQSNELVKLPNADWHPWNDSILAVAYKNNEIAIWNISSKKIIDIIVISEALIVNFSFNPVSAELLVMHKLLQQQSIISVLTVLKSSKHIVDQIAIRDETMWGIYWDNTGTQFATAHVNESIYIWNFFGQNTMLEKAYLKKAKEAWNINTLKILGSTIR